MTQQQQAVHDQGRLRNIGFIFPQLAVPECWGQPIQDTTVPGDDLNDYEIQQAFGEGRMLPSAAV